MKKSAPLTLPSSFHVITSPILIPPTKTVSHVISMNAVGTNYRKMSMNNRNIRLLAHYDRKGMCCQNYDRSQIGRQASPPHTRILL